MNYCFIRSHSLKPTHCRSAGRQATNTHTLNSWERHFDQSSNVGVYCLRTIMSLPQKVYISIDRVRGPYWENIGPRSWQYGPSRFGEDRTRKTEGRYSPSTARANSVDQRFITRLLVSEKTEKRQMQRVFSARRLPKSN